MDARGSTGRARGRRWALVLPLVLALGAGGTPTASGAATEELALEAGPVRFGAAQAAVPGRTKVEAIQVLEGVAQRPLAVHRVYARWDDAFPSSTATWLKQTGRAMFLSVKTKRAGGSVPWRDIAAAGPGDPLHADMVRWADAIQAYEVPVVLSFNHEPETSVSRPSGTDEEYVAAWRAFVGLFRARGVDNVTWAWTTAVRNYSASPTSAKYAPRFYPGDDWVDVLAIDAYNMYCLRKDGRFSRPWRSLEQLLEPFLAFAAQHPGEELAVAEFGTPEDPAQPGRKAAWLDDARLLFSQPSYARFRDVMYWNQLSHNFAGCDFRVTSSASAEEAFRRLAHDPYYSAPSGL